MMGISPKTGDCSSQGSNYQPFDYDNLRYLLSYSQPDPTQPQSQQPREGLATSWQSAIAREQCGFPNLLVSVFLLLLSEISCKENAASKTSLQLLWLHRKHPLVYKHLVINLLNK